MSARGFDDLPAGVVKYPWCYDFVGSRVVDVSANHFSSFAVSDDGRLFSWGSGDSFVLGHGHLLGNGEPKEVEALRGAPIAAVSASKWHALVATRRGEVFSWGEHSPGANQQLRAPMRVEGLRGIPIAKVSVAESIAFGHASYTSNALVVAVDGRVFSWGSGGIVLGHGDEEDQLVPKEVATLRGTPIADIAIGRESAAALAVDGALFTWGSGFLGVLGHGDMVSQWLPSQVWELRGTPVVDMALGATFMLAVTADGAVFSWGGGEFGRLGHGDEEDQWAPKEVEVLRGTPIAAVSAGAAHSLALSQGGAVFSWGYGNVGRLGHGDDADHHVPKHVEALWEMKVAAVSAGSSHSLAVTEAGAVFSWGWGHGGRLGPEEVEWFYSRLQQ